MTTTPLMQMALPVDHNSFEQWGLLLNDLLTNRVDAHNHTTGLGAPVPSAGLRIDADVSWSFGGTSYAITDLKAIDFAAVTAASVAGLAGALFLNSSDNELYYRNTSGTNVKFTAGAALNVAAFTGGIGGDYSAAGALVVFDDATDSYWFQQQIGASVRQYARMRSADVDLYEFKAHPAVGPIPTNRVRLASPAALAASYALTFPGATPASTAIAQVDNAGLITLTNTIVNDLTMASNKSVVVSGTGDYKHGSKTLVVSALDATSHDIGAGIMWNPSTDGTLWTATSVGGLLNFPLRLPTGRRVTQIDFWYTRVGGTLTFDFRRTTLSTNVITSIASTTIATGTALTSISLSAVNYTLLATEQYLLRITAGALNDLAYAIVVTYDYP